MRSSPLLVILTVSASRHVASQGATPRFDFNLSPHPTSNLVDDLSQQSTITPPPLGNLTQIAAVLRI